MNENLRAAVQKLGYVDVCREMAAYAKDIKDMDDENRRHHEYIGDLFNILGDRIEVRCGGRFDCKPVSPIAIDVAMLDAVDSPIIEDPRTMKDLPLSVRRGSDRWPIEDATRSNYVFRFHAYPRGAIGIGGYHDYWIFSHAQAVEYHKALGELIESQREAVMNPHFVVIKDDTLEVNDYGKRIVNFRFDGPNAVLFDSAGVEIARLPLTDYTIKAVQ